MADIDLHKCFDSRSYVSHLILESDRDKLIEVTKLAGYDINSADLVVTLDGVEIRNEDFEEIAKGWVKRILDRKMEEIEKRQDHVDLMHTESYFKEQVNIQAKKMLERLIDKVDEEDE